MKNIIKRVKVVLYVLRIDVVYNAKFRLLLSCGLYILSLFSRVFNMRRSDVLLMKAHHYSDSVLFQTLLISKIKNLLEKEDYIRSLMPEVMINYESLHRKYLFSPSHIRGKVKKELLLSCTARDIMLFLGNMTWSGFYMIIIWF